MQHVSSKDKTLFWESGNDCIRFNCSPGLQVRMPISSVETSTMEKLHDSAAWGSLEDLWGEGKVVELGPGQWELPYDELCRLEPDQIESLGLPPIEPLQVKVQTYGVPGHPGLGISIEIRHSEHGNLEGAVERKGPIYFPAAGPPILARAPVYRLLKLAAEGPESDSIEDHFKFLARAQLVAREAGARLDGYLEAEEYHFPTHLDVGIQEHDAAHVELQPKFRAEEVSEDISSDFLNSGKPPRVHSIRDHSGKRRRVVIGSDVQEQVRQLRQHASIEGSQVPRFIENPQAFLPFDIDLEQFSKRVKGLRTVVYNSRPYLHIRPSEGGWFEGIPGVKLEPIQEKTAEDRHPEDSDSGQPVMNSELYKNLAEQARKKGDEYVRYGDDWAVSYTHLTLPTSSE
ncbi:MAG: hypothetical protein QUT30_08105, partial [Acidobacteriota bacterium]|nr:hypothetical protein [Acidobacteriota bacterium]